MTQPTGKRRGHGEDSIYWDASRNRYVGAVDLGFSPSRARIRKKVSGKTKVEVRDKLKEVHKELNVGLRPRRRYTVGDALDDLLAHGVDGLSERTVTLYRDTSAKALKEELGNIKLTELTASAVQKALVSVAEESSTRTVQIAHNVLTRAIRHAERDDLVGRNVATLVDTPKGQKEGRPSKSLTLEQAMALLDVAKGHHWRPMWSSRCFPVCEPRKYGLCGGIIVAWVDGQWLIKDGYSRMTIGDIVADANITRPTLYRRWKHKFDLVVDALDCGFRMQATCTRWTRASWRPRGTVEGVRRVNPTY